MCIGKTIETKQMNQEMLREFYRGDMNLVEQRSVSVIKLAGTHLEGALLPSLMILLLLVSTSSGR